MKFTPKEDIKGKAGKLFEEGNTYDSEKQGLDDETIERWYRNGWLEIEGRDPSPERNMGGVKIQPHTATHKQKDSLNG